MTLSDQLFRSFWMGGFECSTHINFAGKRLDMIAALEHDTFCAADYRRLKEVGIFTARDGLRWHLIDRCGKHDWSSWIPMLGAARDEGVQVIWDLFHYGWPDDLDIFSPAFVNRFALFAAEAARIHREHTDEIAFFSPVNEISFCSWAASRDFIFPFAGGYDLELKRQLVRATIAAIGSILAVNPRARFVAPEPLIHNVPPLNEPWNTGPALVQRNGQFEAWDMIAGRSSPELGGDARCLDILGLNFYAGNEWEMPGGGKLHWDAGSHDPRWLPLRFLLAEIHQRYGRPLFLAETGHYGIGRAPWLREVAAEIKTALESGVPVGGACLYPIIDRCDWGDPGHWHNCGLWDVEKDAQGHYRRILNLPYAKALVEAQEMVST